MYKADSQVGKCGVMSERSISVLGSGSFLSRECSGGAGSGWAWARGCGAAGRRAGGELSSGGGGSSASPAQLSSSELDADGEDK